MSDVQEQIDRALEDSDAAAGTAVEDEEPLSADPKPDRTRQFTHTGFSRVRTGWRGDDARTVMELEGLSAKVIQDRFAVAFAIQRKIQKSVRTQAHDGETGEFLAYPDGDPMWVKDELGIPVEDWTALGDQAREGLLFTIVTHMFEWEIEAAKIWTDAMYAKGIWEEVFARGFTALPAGVVSGKPTIDDRTQWGHKNAAEDRYFALFRSGISRQADGILRAMRALQRLLENTSQR